MFGPITGNAGDPCVVCSDPITEDASAVCKLCGKSFHLILSQKIGGKDCGNVSLDDDTFAMQFLCGLCLADSGALPDGDPGFGLGLPPPTSSSSDQPDPNALPPDPTAADEPSAGPRNSTRGRIKHTGTRVRDILRRWRS